MNNKKKIIIFLIVLLIVILSFIAFWVIKKYKNNVIECQSISGGSFSLIFDTNEGNEIDSMPICIACGPDTYGDLPTPVKDNYVFSGWYYDKELTKGVKTMSTLDIEAEVLKDKNGCIIGYNDITLYAKWGENVIEISSVSLNQKSISLTVGSTQNVEVTIEPIDATNKVLKWTTSNELIATVKDGKITGLKIGNAIITVESNNGKVATVKVNVIEATPTYKCEDGYSLNGTKCIKTLTIKASYVCPENTTEISDVCVTLVGNKKVEADKVCPSKMLPDGSGGTSGFNGVLYTQGLTGCAYREMTEYTTQSSCISEYCYQGNKCIWLSSRNKCYFTTTTDYTSSCSDTANYIYVKDPNQYENINGLNGGCYPKQNKTGYCSDSSYTFMGDGTCTKTIVENAIKSS